MRIFFFPLVCVLKGRTLHLFSVITKFRQKSMRKTFFFLAITMNGNLGTWLFSHVLSHLALDCYPGTPQSPMISTTHSFIVVFSIQEGKVQPLFNWFPNRVFPFLFFCIVSFFVIPIADHYFELRSTRSLVRLSCTSRPYFPFSFLSLFSFYTFLSLISSFLTLGRPHFLSRLFGLFVLQEIQDFYQKRKISPSKLLPLTLFLVSFFWDGFSVLTKNLLSFLFHSHLIPSMERNM